MKKRKEAEQEISVSQENIFMSIVPTVELREKLGEFSQKIRSLETVDLENFTDEISKIIENNEENFLALDLDVQEIVGNLLTSTMEAEVVSMIRSLSMDVKRAQGYKVYNRGKDEIKEKIVNREQLKQKLEKILSIIEADNFDIGMNNLNKYIRVNIRKLLEELK